MRVKVVRAVSTAEAMARIRAELGPDALILASRRCEGGVEVTAALEQEDLAPPPLVVPPSPRPAAPPAAPATDPARLAALSWHGVPPSLAQALSATAVALPAALARALRFGALPLAPGAPPLLLAGPPGAGKTLTVARLATRLVMAGTPPLVITADGQRAGAAEQLAAYTRLLGLTLLVAGNPVALSRALAHRTAGAPVLIDAPGTDPFDPGSCEALAGLAAAAGAAHALVLPAGTDPAEAADLALAWRDLGATLLVATRLDISRRLGAVLTAAEAGALALAEAGTGPGAADGLVQLTPDMLAARLVAPPPPLPGPRTA